MIHLEAKHKTHMCNKERKQAEQLVKVLERDFEEGVKQAENLLKPWLLNGKTRQKHLRHYYEILTRTERKLYFTGQKNPLLNELKQDIATVLYTLDLFEPQLRLPRTLKLYKRQRRKTQQKNFCAEMQASRLHTYLKENGNYKEHGGKHLKNSINILHTLYRDTPKHVNKKAHYKALEHKNQTQNQGACLVQWQRRNMLENLSLEDLEIQELVYGKQADRNGRRLAILPRNLVENETHHNQETEEALIEEPLHVLNCDDKTLETAYKLFTESTNLKQSFEQCVQIAERI